MSETPIALLVPPDLPALPRGRPLPAAPLPRAALSDDDGPVVLGVAAVDGSGRVRERNVLAALEWGRGDALDIRIVRDIAVLHTAPRGCLRVDGRDQIALPSGCRAVLGIKPRDRVLLAALPARRIALMCPMAIATGWIRAGISDLPGLFDA